MGAPTYDDDPVASLDAAAAAHPFGQEVADLLDRARESSKQRTQALGRKARAALEAVEKAIAVEQGIADHEAAIARLRRGED